MKENPYKFFKFKPAKGNRQYLTIEEVKKVMNFQTSSGRKNIYHAQKMFVFSCFTGLRFSDVINLKYNNIKSNPERIEITMEKTSKPIVIPLSGNAKAIINDYKKDSIIFDEKSIFPKIANTTINKELKQLMILAGVNKHISHHSARHSFATLHISLETSLPHLKELLGHQNINDTMIYAKTMEKDLYKSIDHLDSVFKAVG